MSNVTVVGAQWGDEGKGKIVDLLSDKTDMVVRFQGGHNAGHTIVVNNITYKLSLLPSGVVQGKPSIIGNGVVIDPQALLDEIARVKEQGLLINPENLSIAENSPLILPFHVALDLARENARGNLKIGTTGRGIGPAYEDKIARRAIRVCDLADKEILLEKLDELLFHYNTLLSALGEATFDKQKLCDQLLALAPKILPFSKPTWKLLDQAVKNNKAILFEGAQGVMLDVDHGTYPCVTSSNTLPASVSLGAGVGPKAIGYILGIAKTYCTRVGSGIFPTELCNDLGNTLADRGKEFGTVTKRLRRCGWFDAVQVRQAVQITGISGIALTKLDVLDVFTEIKVCIGYRIGDKELDYLPALLSEQKNIVPIYKTLEGWSENTKGIKLWSDLPSRAKQYIDFISTLIGVPVIMISTGSERDETIIRQDPFEFDNC